MRFPSDPPETERNAFVRSALQEAARYEAETPAPEHLAVRALARHERAGRPCGQTRLVPRLAASAAVLLLLTSAAIRMQQTSQSALNEPRDSGQTYGKREVQQAMLPDLDLSAVTLPAITPDRLATFAGTAGGRHRFSRHAKLPRRRHSYAPAPPPERSELASANSMWKTETVQCQVITQAVTPVWVAQADPETATITVTPALFQIALQPADDADSNASPVAATLIPVRLEQENSQP